MNKLITTIYFIIISTLVWSQNPKEFQVHLTSIDSTYYPGHIIDRMDTVFNTNRAFVDYTIEHYLQEPEDKYFIADRRLLRKLSMSYCDSIYLVIRDTLKNGDSCVLSLKSRQFVPEQHSIDTNKDTSHVFKIDGQFPFGGQYMIPEIEIGLLSLQVDGNKIPIPSSAYGNLYYPEVCEDWHWIRAIEAYESMDGEYIYLYVYGGQAAGSYFGKLVFNRTGYVTKILADYYGLSIHSSFRDNFIGF